MKRIIICLLIGFYGMLDAHAQTRNISIVYIGNSITYGAGLDSPATQAPPVVASAWLRKQKGVGDVNFSNQGHSGYTTLDFLPGTPAFAQAEQAAKALANVGALLIFSIKIGTNDSAIQGPHGSPVSTDNYKANLKAITDRLLTDFPGAIVIYQHPLWYSPSTYNGSKYLQEGLTRLQSYIPIIDALAADYKAANPNHVFVGDTKAFKYFEKNYLTDFQAEPGRQGTFYLHPNKKGAAALGEFWGKAIYKVVKRLSHK
ncbi:lipolytic protein G-D-S-L family [Mucilaginibacter sp. ZT4R22]|uniref:Lipolytic protein G-D-S-L family n=1 Tax=Mucilaginibacter pankratovii TaxID=2772110 RepID=A0ABR7WZ26_9SPHI|nr:GDSL-type esterase/lipase family protein [Mucilaginibacter pankratovii]MBD1367550.1 lipolytic protein G-D-S-L family [Mucilaginibacter pankratovii]